MGVCLYTFLFGAVPFKGNNLVQVYENIKNETLSFDMEVEISPECRDLIVWILTKDPDKRPSLVQVMEHIWVTKGGVFPLAVYGSTPEAELVTVTEAEARAPRWHNAAPPPAGAIPRGCLLPLGFRIAHTLSFNSLSPSICPLCSHSYPSLIHPSPLPSFSQIAVAVEFQKMTSSLKPVLKEVEFKCESPPRNCTGPLRRIQLTLPQLCLAPRLAPLSGRKRDSSAGTAQQSSEVASAPSSPPLSSSVARIALRLTDSRLASPQPLPALPLALAGRASTS